jgi:hypothetical protein
MSSPSEDQEPEAICMGCNNVIEEGSVVAFGESLFHLEWYVLISSTFLIMRQNGVSHPWCVIPALCVQNVPAL